MYSSVVYDRAIPWVDSSYLHVYFIACTSVQYGEIHVLCVCVCVCVCVYKYNVFRLGEITACEHNVPPDCTLRIPYKKVCYHIQYFFAAKTLGSFYWVMTQCSSSVCCENLFGLNQGCLTSSLFPTCTVLASAWLLKVAAAYTERTYTSQAYTAQWHIPRGRTANHSRSTYAHWIVAILSQTWLDQPTLPTHLQ